MAKDTPQSNGLDWKKLHLWQIQPVRDGLTIAAAFGLFLLGYKLSVVTVPLLLALALAYLFEPVVARITRSGRVGRPFVAASIIILAAVVIVVPAVIGVSVAVVQGIKIVQQAGADAAALQRSIADPGNEDLRRQVEVRGKSWVNIRDWVVEQERRVNVVRERQKQALPEQPSPGSDGAAPESPSVPGEVDAPPAGAEDAKADKADQVQETSMATAMADLLVPPEESYLAIQFILRWLEANGESIGKQALAAGGATVGGALGAALSTFSWFGKVLFGAFLTAFFFYFCCVGYDRVLRFIGGLVPERKKQSVFSMVEQMDRVIAGFIRGRLTICAILILYYVVGYWLIGVPAWALLGIVVGALTLVPYAAGVGIPVAIMLLWLAGYRDIRGEWWWVLGAPLLVHGAQQLVDDYFLTPKIQGNTTRLDTPTILFASIAGGALAGFYGLLLAIPFAACLKILLRELFWPRFRAWTQGRASDILPIGQD